jgi:hypothetical protein
MRIRRIVLLSTTFVILCLIGLLGTGCGQRPEASPAREVSRSLNLPRLHISYDEEGEPTILGLQLSTLERYGGLNLSMVRLPAEQISQIMDWNVQHVELALAPDGLFIFLNNEPLPYLAWDGETLANAGRIVDDMGVLPETVTRFAPAQKALPFLLRALGIGVALEFPVAPGQEAIAFESHPHGAPAPPSAEAAETEIALHLALEYDQVGEPSVAGIQLRELGDLTGQPLAIGSLDEGTMSTLGQAGIELLLVRLESRGLVPYVDGQPMPYITWGDEHLLNLIDFLEASNRDSPLGNPELLDVLRRAVPGVKEADIQLSAQFPAQP